MPVYDRHANFAYSNVVTAPVPSASGTSLTVTAGTGVLFPTPPFNCTVWPSGEAPFAQLSEIIRVTNIVGDTFTIIRTQEGSTNRGIVVNDQIGNTITVKTLTDVQAGSMTNAIAMAAALGS